MDRLKFYTILFDLQPEPYALRSAHRLHVYIAAPEDQAGEKEKHVVRLLEEYFEAEAKETGDPIFKYVLHSKLPPERLKKRIDAWLRSTGPRVMRIRNFAADPFRVSLGGGSS